MPVGAIQSVEYPRKRAMAIVPSESTVQSSPISGNGSWADTPRPPFSQRVSACRRRGPRMRRDSVGAKGRGIETKKRNEFRPGNDRVADESLRKERQKERRGRNVEQPPLSIARHAQRSESGNQSRKARAAEAASSERLSPLDR